MMESHYLTINGVKIHYLSGGKGKPAVFIHGHRSDAKRFQGLFSKVSKKYKIYAPDLPGFGKSEELASFHNLENYFPYVLGFIEKLNLKRFTLIGASMGVILATLAAMEMPQKVEKAVFLAPVFDRSSFKIPRIKYLPIIFLLLAFPKSRFLVKLINGIIRNDRIFKRFLKFFLTSESQEPEVLDYEVKQWRVMDIKVWAQTLASLLTFRFPKKRVKIRAKALFIFPEGDQYLDIPKTIQNFAEIFPNYELLTIPGLKHMPKGELSQVLRNPAVRKVFDKI
ncbi:MAG: alpha/beta hydrolase [bacterium]|nr:alpha/beta hydrolase [bacterium]